MRGPARVRVARGGRSPLGDTPYALVLWPESSTDIDPFVDVLARAEIESAVSAIDAPIVVGAVTGVPNEPGRVRNQAIAWLPATGPGASYTKRQLVPFGEYVPARGLLERLSSRFADVVLPLGSGGGLVERASIDSFVVSKWLVGATDGTERWRRAALKSPELSRPG